MRYNCAYIVLLAAALAVGGCSSSTFQSRVSSQEKEESRTQEKERRFSSERKKDSTESDSESRRSFGEFDDAPIERLKEEARTTSRTFSQRRENIISSRNAAKFTNSEAMMAEIIKYLDTPYKYGGNDLHGIDCSAFTKIVFQNTAGVELPRTARDQYKVGESISEESLIFGDLVFFNTRRGAKPGHVGIYVGENMFAHATRSLGVAISSLDEDYYKRRYMGARRITDQVSPSLRK